MFRSIAIVSCFAALLAVASVGPASADCAANIEAVKKDRQMSNNAQANEAVDRILARAQEALKEGKEKRCQKLVQNARNKL